MYSLKLIVALVHLTSVDNPDVGVFQSLVCWGQAAAGGGGAAAGLPAPPPRGPGSQAGTLQTGHTGSKHQNRRNLYD